MQPPGSVRLIQGPGKVALRHLIDGPGSERVAGRSSTGGRCESEGEVAGRAIGVAETAVSVFAGVLLRNRAPERRAA